MTSSLTPPRPYRGALLKSAKTYSHLLIQLSSSLSVTILCLHEQVFNLSIANSFTNHLISCLHAPILSLYVITRRDLQRHINHIHGGRLAAASEQKEATAADVQSYVNGQCRTSAEPKLEAAEVKVKWAEGPR